jgi:hypothetical protein
MKGNENVVVDALSRISSGELCALELSTISTNIIKKVRALWEKIRLYKPSFNLFKDPISHPIISG